MSTHWQKETHKKNIRSLISNSKTNEVKNYIFKALKTNNCTPRLLGARKLPRKNPGEIKVFQDRPILKQFVTTKPANAAEDIQRNAIARGRIKTITIMTGQERISFIKGTDKQRRVRTQSIMSNKNKQINHQYQ